MLNINVVHEVSHLTQEQAYFLLYCRTVILLLIAWSVNERLLSIETNLVVVESKVIFQTVFTGSQLICD